MPNTRFLVVLSIVLTSCFSFALPGKGKPFDNEITRKDPVSDSSASNTLAQQTTQLVSDVRTAFPSIDSSSSAMTSVLNIQLQTSQGNIAISDLIQAVLQVHKTNAANADSSTVSKIMLSADLSFVDGILFLTSKMNDPHSREGTLISEMMLDGLKMTQQQISMHQARVSAAKMKIMSNLIRSHQAKTSEEAFVKIEGKKGDEIMAASADLYRMSQLVPPQRGHFVLSDDQGKQVKLVSYESRPQVNMHSRQEGGGYTPSIRWMTIVDEVKYDLSSSGQPEEFVTADGTHLQTLVFSQTQSTGFLPGLPGLSKKRNRMISVRVDVKTGQVVSAVVIQNSLLSQVEELKLTPQ
jgi:hypothetical protein